MSRLKKTFILTFALILGVGGGLACDMTTLHMTGMAAMVTGVMATLFVLVDF